MPFSNVKLNGTKFQSAAAPTKKFYYLSSVWASAHVK